MEVWLSFRNNQDKFQLPVTPKGYGVTRGKSNQTININNLGDIKLIGKEGLRKMTMESFLPNHNYSFIDSVELWEPAEYVKMIEKWQETEEPIRVIYTDTPINYPMSIESFTWGEEDGTGDVYFTLELEEYIYVKKVEDEIKKAKRPGKEKLSTKKHYRYQVKSGDTLFKLAKAQYGKGKEWPKIYNYRENKKVIGKNPNVLHKGQLIWIPRK